MTHARPMLYALLAAALLLGLGRCAGARASESRAKVERAELVAYHAALRSIQHRAVTDSVTRKVDSLSARVAVLGRDLYRERAKLAHVLDSATATLADSAATVPELRLALSRTVESARALSISVLIYQDSISVLLDAHLAERSAWMAERQAHLAELAAKDAVIGALKATECRVLWVRCPTRTASAIGGAVLALALVVAVR